MPVDRSAQVVFIGGLSREIVHKINLNFAIVRGLNYYMDKNTYNKPKNQNGLMNKLN